MTHPWEHTHTRTSFEAFSLRLWSELQCFKRGSPSQHAPAFQNSLLGNLETDLKGKNYSGPPTPTMHTCAHTRKEFHKSLVKVCLEQFLLTCTCVQSIQYALKSGSFKRNVLLHLCVTLLVGQVKTMSNIALQYSFKQRTVYTDLCL